MITLESLDNCCGGGDSSSTICFSLLILSVASSLLGNKEGGKLEVSAMLLIAHSVITWYSLSDKAASICAPKKPTTTHEPDNTADHEPDDTAIYAHDNTKC